MAPARAGVPAWRLGNRGSTVHSLGCCPGTGWYAEPGTRLGALGALAVPGFTPAMVLFGVFFGAPMAMIVMYSFWTQNGYSIVAHWTLANYRTIFSTPVYVDTFLTRSG